MKTPKIAKAMSYIDDDLIVAAVYSKKEPQRRRWIKQLGVAACAAVILLVAIVVFPLSNNNIPNTPPIDNTPSVEEPSPLIENPTPPIENPDVSIDMPMPPVEESTPDIEVTAPPVEQPTTPTTNPTQSTTKENIIEKKYCYVVNDDTFSSYVGGKVIAEEKIGNKISVVSVTAGWKNSSNEWISRESLRAEIYSIDGVSNDVAVALKFLDKGEAVTTTHFYVIMNPNADLNAVKDYIIGTSTPTNQGNDIAGEGIVTGHTNPFSN